MYKIDSRKKLQTTTNLFFLKLQLCYLNIDVFDKYMPKNCVDSSGNMEREILIITFLLLPRDQESIYVNGLFG